MIQDCLNGPIQTMRLGWFFSDDVHAGFKAGSTTYVSFVVDTVCYAFLCLSINFFFVQTPCNKHGALLISP
jgi:hypothetical protein